MKIHVRKFPSSPVVKTSPSNAGSVGLIPGQGVKIPRHLLPKKKQNSEATLKQDR